MLKICEKCPHPQECGIMKGYCPIRMAEAQKLAFGDAVLMSPPGIEGVDYVLVDDMPGCQRSVRYLKDIPVEY